MKKRALGMGIFNVGAAEINTSARQDGRGVGRHRRRTQVTLCTGNAKHFNPIRDLKIRVFKP